MASTQNWCIYIIFYTFFQLIPKKPQEIKNTKKEIMKHVKELMISNEIANQDNENILKTVRGSIL